MIKEGKSENQYLRPLLSEIIQALNHAGWRDAIHHIYREANRGADFLATKGHSCSFEWVLIERACPLFGVILLDDSRGCSMPRRIV